MPVLVGYLRGKCAEMAWFYLGRHLSLILANIFTLPFGYGVSMVRLVAGTGVHNQCANALLPS